MFQFYMEHQVAHPNFPGDGDAHFCSAPLQHHSNVAITLPSPGLPGDIWTFLLGARLAHARSLREPGALVDVMEKHLSQ